MMQWHVVVIAVFAIGASVYLVGHSDDTAGWLYVGILLLGMAAAFPQLGPELTILFGQANTQAPQRQPGQVTGPF